MREEFISRLKAKGLEKVMLEVAQGVHGPPESKRCIEVTAWIRAKQASLEADSSARRDAREEATLSIAKEANRIASSALAITESEARLARRSRWIDRIIPAIAIIIAAIAARDDIRWLISWVISKFP